MRHGYGNKKLGRPTDQRIALIRSITMALVKNKRIETTLDRAKATKRYAEKLITWGKLGGLHGRREALKMLPDNETVSVIFELAEKYRSRNGGYTRCIPIGMRRGDAAEMVILEFVEAS